MTDRQTSQDSNDSGISEVLYLPSLWNGQAVVILIGRNLLLRKSCPRSQARLVKARPNNLNSFELVALLTCRAAKEREKQREADRASTLRNRRRDKSSALGEEPSQGSSSSIHIRIKLPDGRNYQRRFLATDPMQV